MKPIRVFIHVESGLVQQVISDHHNVKICVFDVDNIKAGAGEPLYSDPDELVYAGALRNLPGHRFKHLTGGYDSHQEVEK